MATLIAIHGENGFARSWPAIAEGMGVAVRRVHGYGNEIWRDLEGCTALLWVVNHEDATDLAFARSILLAAEQRGLRVFPDHRTVWHFDDKVAQKYLLESVGAPLADTWVFFDPKEADAFLARAEYPLVFKLRRGAGAINVRLVHSAHDGRKLVRRMFGHGMRAFPAGESVKRAMQRGRQRSGRGSLVERGRRAFRVLARKVLSPQREHGYVLFQRFVPLNQGDVRVTIIGDRAFTFTRSVRPNDFRASGSGLIAYPAPSDVPLDMVDVAFSVAAKLGTQSLALDLVRDPRTQAPLLLEVSYTFTASLVASCPGFVSRDHTWHAGNFDPAELILRDLLARPPAAR
jgi:glutathione synthase/RimK-type ligase-like ATP-grasp enzyme